MNRDFAARQRGETRTQNFQRASAASRPSPGFSRPGGGGGGGRPSGAVSRPSGVVVAAAAAAVVAAAVVAEAAVVVAATVGFWDCAGTEGRTTAFSRGLPRIHPPQGRAAFEESYQDGQGQERAGAPERR